MLRIISSLRNISRPLLRNARACLATNRQKKYKVIEDPSDVSKLVFDEDGLCKIY